MQPTLYLVNHIVTHNFKDSDVIQKFGRLWQEPSHLFAGGKAVYGIYHNYRSDYKGDYTCSTATETVQEKADVLVPPETDYRIFPCTRETVLQTWQQIWQLEENGGLSRAYQVDYEKYCADGSVEIHIGLKAQ